MKICFLTKSVYKHAGLGRVVHSLADELTARGHEIGVVAPAGETQYKASFVSLQLNVRTPLTLIRELWQIRKFVRDYDVLVALDPRPVGIIAHLACIGLGKKIIIQCLGTYALFEEHAPIKNTLMKWAYARSAKVFVINSFVQKCIEASLSHFSFGSNMAHVPVGVDTKLFYTQKPPTHTYARHYIVSVGALKPRKGQLQSLKAFCTIATAFPDLHYVIVGDTDDPGYLKDIKAAIAEAGLQERVHLVQKISDAELIDLYSGAQFFILTPTSTAKAIEGFGMVYIEAALCGVTAIGTWNTGAEAAIEHEKSGLLVHESVEDIAEGMSALLSDETKRVAYAKYAKQRAGTFDWTYIVDRYEQEINSIK